MLERTDANRLATLYEELRSRLLDLSNRNRMLNYPLGQRSRRHLQVVDEVIDEVYRRLVGDGANLDLAAIPEPDSTPDDEKTPAFVASLEHAKAADIEYLTRLEALESEGRDDDYHLALAETELRLRLRETLQLGPRPKLHEISRAEHARRLGIDPSPDLQPVGAKSAHADKALQTLRYPEELEALAARIADEARLAEQEMGVSTLFLSMGFLERTETETSERRYHAPLLLLPVTLKSRTVRGRTVWSLSAVADAAETNLSLRKLLERDFKRDLPDFETGEDEKIASIETYFAKVRDAVEGIHGGRWSVRRWLVLGHFAFGRFAMYADLAPENWPVHPVQHGKLVDAVLRGTEAGPGSVDFRAPDDYEVDDPEIEAVAPYLVQDADASQHSALIDVMNWKNLVIEGPPGTGKSQTITNIIANALAADQTVLFLAEKQAALDVVKRRLDRAGLGDFCLELHSDKASPREVVESLRRRVELSPFQPSALAVDPLLVKTRAELGDYLKALHRPAADGETPFGMMWRAIRGRMAAGPGVAALAGVGLDDALLGAPERLAAARDLIELTAEAGIAHAKAFGPPAASPWASAALMDLPTAEIQPLKAFVAEVRRPAAEIAELVAAQGQFGLAGLADLQRMADADAAIGRVPANATIPLVADVAADDLAHAIDLLEELQGLDAAIAAGPPVAEADPAVLARPAALIGLGADPQATAATLYAVLEAQRADNAALTALTERLAPAVQRLRLSPDLPATVMETVAGAVVAAGALAPEERERIDRFPGVTGEVLASAVRRRDDLIEAEAQWRSLFPSVGAGPWPTPEEVAATAKTLKRGGLARLIDMSSASRDAKAVVKRLFGAAKPELDMLEALAGYLGFKRDFEVDPSLAGPFGFAWNGLDTRFDLAAESLAARRKLAETLEGKPAAAEVLVRMVALGGDVIAGLGEFREPAAALLALPEAERAGLKSATLGQVHLALAKELAGADAILAADPDRRLAALDAPLGAVAAAAELIARSNALTARLDALPLAPLARRAAPDAAGIAATREALAWVAQVRDLGLPSAAETALSGAQAGAARALIGALAAKARPLLAAVATLRRDAAERFGDLGLDGDDAGALSDRLAALDATGAEIGSRLALRRRRRDADAAGLAPFLDAADRIGIEPGALVGVFDRFVAERRADRARRADPALSHQSGTGLDATRAKFAERDRAKIAADRLRVRSLLSRKEAVGGLAAGPKSTWTEAALLRNEFAKQRRHTPVRALVGRAGASIQALKPCFMMSPLSLAKFLEPGGLGFDLLVIDEASQMRPEDAIGALLRARRLVVVGDPKQLPPTDFFARTEAAPADDDIFEDLDDESILDACQKTFRLVRRLKWHYRSRCESLIAFSNREFYESKLVTFPTARPGSFSIDLVRVDGAYRARRNPQEAMRVAEEAVAFMRRFAEAEDDGFRTLGIVAVNMEQRDLIREELRRLTAGDAAVERFAARSEERGEPLFVKNLENVQGDERDVIFISLTYGREPGARAVKQRFGPINGKQGHRRLNVLFSRARSRIALFTSFGSADVVPTESSSRGVSVLKAYLDYAETGGRAPVESVGGEAESDFEAEVAGRLRARGYAVDAQVGVSGYRIDLGVRHPDHPDRYLAGIECDGATYHRSRSARDRDRLRETVLSDLGWHLLRVWSTDWFDDPDAETETLVRRIEALRAEPPRATIDDGVATTGAAFHPVDDEPAAAAPADLRPFGTAVPEVPGLVPFGEHDAAASGQDDRPIPPFAVTGAAEQDAAVSSAPEPAATEKIEADEQVGAATSPEPETPRPPPLAALPDPVPPRPALPDPEPAPRVTPPPLPAFPEPATATARPLIPAGAGGLPDPHSPEGEAGSRAASYVPDYDVGILAALPALKDLVDEADDEDDLAPVALPQPPPRRFSPDGEPIPTIRFFLGFAPEPAPAAPAAASNRTAGRAALLARAVNGTAFDFGSGPLTASQAQGLLGRFRETVVAHHVPDWNRQQSLLRDAVIEAAVARRVTDPADWSWKVPEELRAATSPVETKLYLGVLCDTVARIEP
jgi:very-short-patch-repair endonuclease